MKFDIKDLRLGFWIGAGLFLFSAVLAILTWLVNKGTGGRGMGVKHDGG